MIIIKGSTDLSEIKRCYIDASIKIPCPKCDTPILFDFTTNYVSYLKTGFMDNQGGYCNECEEFFHLPFRATKVEVALEVFPEDIKIDK